MRRKALAVVGALAACATRPDLPLVQPPDEGAPAAVVRIDEKGFGTPCLVISAGETVEWRNAAPGVPSNVTGLGNGELYSPSIVEGGPMGEAKRADGSVERYAFWRHTFAAPGVYEYYDTNRGEPGRKVVDPYYGKVTYVGTAPSLDTAVVCVEVAGSKQCTAVCCLKNDDGTPLLGSHECPKSQCCDLGRQRCLLGSPAAPICAPHIGSVGGPAHRQFQCFSDADCPSTPEGKPQVCATDPSVSHVCQKAP